MVPIKRQISNKLWKDIKKSCYYKFSNNTVLSNNVWVGVNRGVRREMVIKLMNNVSRIKNGISKE